MHVDVVVDWDQRLVLEENGFGLLEILHAGLLVGLRRRLMQQIVVFLVVVAHEIGIASIG